MKLSQLPGTGLSLLPSSCLSRSGLREQHALILPVAEGLRRGNVTDAQAPGQLSARRLRRYDLSLRIHVSKEAPQTWRH